MSERSESKRPPGQNPEPRHLPDRVNAVIVGAGFAGLAAAMALRAQGIDDFLVIERGPSVGGTWRDNTYPGVACDIPSHLYGFANHPNPQWSGLFARGDEIRAYLERVAGLERIAPLLNTTMLDARWDDGVWRVRCSGAHAGEIAASTLLLACGRLTEPKIPDVPGLESFPGPIFHSARWDHTTDLRGARVAVIGTGATAVQLVPELAKVAEVTLFQRTPAWIVPRDDRAYSPAERASFTADPAVLARLRDELYAEGEARFASRSGDRDAAAAARAVALQHLAEQVPDRALRRALTPDYAFGCKRVLLSDAFYPALSSGAVTLEASALAAVEGSTLVAASGGRHTVDAVVLATGFESTEQPYADLVRGEHDTLAAHWDRGMTSFGSTVVAGFPNLFVLDGPNASLGHNSSVLMIEAQAAYAARTLARHPGVRRVDPAAEDAYTDEIDRAAASTPWISGGCRNWYVDERSGRLTLLWPGTVDAFRATLDTDGGEFLPVTIERGAR
ncbi:NAD(P)/FAD-dependent oxidoreductase [Microbacterium horticulturae]|uniref:NAD(P)/FAD-dependent oxidoreductase n=1 Tax=Microbacterium horticulturae TaxID=3028316 RepID=A0ABY8BVX2_9MICO|nr:NAD(P)/FAD-dependent oxidoreductase [Microbacterium sp. KACC 23027]WEG08334.1 NAD(P)/FAD-dependent oxidoreductase [Microbacterium sp. KACC 23027]